MKDDADDYVELEVEGDRRGVTWKETEDWSRGETDGRPIEQDAESEPDTTEWSMSEFSKKLVYIELASVILIVICGMRLGEGEGDLQFAFIVGLVSLIACLAMRAIEKKSPGALSASRNVGESNVKFSIEAVLGGLMIWWWLVGALTMTFKGPFLVASNGYFASWLGLFGSLMWAAPVLSKDAEQKFSELKGKSRCLAAVFVSSIILAIASIEWLSSVEGAVGVGCGVLSMLVVFVVWLRHDKMDKKLLRSIATFLAIMWIGAAGLLTFVGPFLLAGNGFFACWAGAFCSIRYWRMEFGDKGYF